MQAMVWLLKIAASMMLIATVAIDTVLLVAWVAIGIIDGEWSRIPLWVILVASFFSFFQFLISSFLYGVSRQVATNRGADLKDLPLDEKLSDTIDEGWTTTLKVAKLSLAVISAVISITVIIFFNDLNFLVGFHRGMELNRDGDGKGAQRWFRNSVSSAGSDRIAIARFLLAGSLIQEQKFADAETELRQSIRELDATKEDNQALLVYLYSALSNCLVLQSKLPEAETWAAKAVQVIESNPNLLGLRLRLIGSYSQFLIPEAPPLAIALGALQDIYIKEGKFDLALAAYQRILQAIVKKPKSTEAEIFDELSHFLSQLLQARDAKTAPLEEKAIAMSADMLIQKFKAKDKADFDRKYFEYVKRTNQLNRIPKQ